MDLLYSEGGNAADGDYADFLEDVLHLGRFGSIKFSGKNHLLVKYKHKVERTPEQVWRSVLSSDRVQWIANSVAREEEKDKTMIMKDATRILKDMAYKDHFNLVRCFGFAMYHVMNCIYQDGVFYNTDTLQRIRKVITEHPVVLMPSHRCYMDFLVVSILSVHLNLPLPAIASGMDFMKMAGVSYLLRSSGAFFMRRSFGSDRLYWALFTEYIHTLIINGDRSIEFFIEGTRSRSGKSLTPKLGLFSVVAEPYLKAQIYDTMIIPVSISYDRILEESLYAYELLGVPKPKESTSGLLKATGILSENYGSMHVHFAEPISIRGECGHMDRMVHACYPRYMLRLTSQEQTCLTELAYKVLQIQQRNMVISTWSIIATILCQSQGGIKFNKLLESVQWLYDILRKCGVRTRIPGGNVEDAVKQLVFRYDHLVMVLSEDAEETSVMIRESGSQPRPPTERMSKLDSYTRDKAAVHIMLASYRNQLVHIFVRPALVAYAINKAHNLERHKVDDVALSGPDLMDDFAFTLKLFHNEFIFAPNRTEKDYVEGMHFLRVGGAVSGEGDALRLNIRGTRLVKFLLDLLHPFFLCYQLICEYITQFHHACEVKQLCTSIQLWMANRMHEKHMLPEVLSMDMINNGIHGLGRAGAIKLNKVTGKNMVHVRRNHTRQLGVRIVSFMDGGSGQPTIIPLGIPDPRL